MATNTHRGGSSQSRARAWLVRIAVLLAFAVTVWWQGPRAAAVLAARVAAAAPAGPAVVLDRVGFGERPEWLDGPVLVAVARDLQPWLVSSVPIRDEEAARALRAGLRQVAWVADAHLERLFPDRFRVQVDLRRPVLRVRDGAGAGLCLCDRSGIALPWVDVDTLPEVWLYREGGPSRVECLPGQVVGDDRVVAAAAVAVEWRDELAPLVPSCPRLIEVDATNLGERWLVGPRYPEIRVKLLRNDGAAVVFSYDRPPGSALPRVPVATKAAVLRQILAAHPGLAGLVAGELRFQVRWQDWLQPRRPGVADPVGDFDAPSPLPR